MVWWKPYEALLEAKVVPAKEVLLDLIAKELLEMCATFPPRASEIIWFDGALRDTWAHRIEDLPPIHAPMAAVMGELLLWDLQHEIEAIDHFVRNALWRKACASELEWGAVQICWRSGLELLYQRKEDCSGIVNRADLIQVVQRFIALAQKKLSSPMCTSLS